MATGIPSIACIAVIGKEVSRNERLSVPACRQGCSPCLCYQNNPLHISTFPPDTRPELQFSLLLSSTLDIFDVRIAHKVALQDFGLLQAVDERLACYGWLTNTGVKFVIVVDMAGRPIGADGGDGRGTAIGMIGLREADLRPVSDDEYIPCFVAAWLTPSRHSTRSRQPTSSSS